MDSCACMQQQAFRIANFARTPRQLSGVRIIAIGYSIAIMLRLF
jgi:hypothetical protein